MKRMMLLMLTVIVLSGCPTPTGGNGNGDDDPIHTHSWGEWFVTGNNTVPATCVDYEQIEWRRNCSNSPTHFEVEMRNGDSPNVNYHNGTTSNSSSVRCRDCSTFIDWSDSLDWSSPLSYWKNDDGDYLGFGYQTSPGEGTSAFITSTTGLTPGLEFYRLINLTENTFTLKYLNPNQGYPNMWGNESYTIEYEFGPGDDEITIIDFGSFPFPIPTGVYEKWDRIY